MKVSDKDFDQLFSTKLADMEIEPSATVWSNIADELDGTTQSKKSGIPFMRIAAGIIVIMGIALIFLRPKIEKVELHNAIAATKPVHVNHDESSIKSFEEPPIDTSSISVAKTIVSVKHQQKQLAVKQNDEPVKSQIDSAQYAGVSQPNNEVNIQHTADIPKQNIPAIDVNTPVLPKYNAPVKPVNAIAANIPAQKNAEPVKRKKIHSLGDILNIVIAKVDKREDKIIEFTNTNDDDSFTVTGLNLGVIRAKRQN
jgi:hypothetical protein